MWPSSHLAHIQQCVEWQAFNLRVGWLCWLWVPNICRTCYDTFCSVGRCCCVMMQGQWCSHVGLSCLVLCHCLHHCLKLLHHFLICLSCAVCSTFATLTIAQAALVAVLLWWHWWDRDRPILPLTDYAWYAVIIDWWRMVQSFSMVCLLLLVLPPILKWVDHIHLLLRLYSVWMQNMFLLICIAHLD